MANKKKTTKAEETRPYHIEEKEYSCKFPKKGPLLYSALRADGAARKHVLESYKGQSPGKDKVYTVVVTNIGTGEVRKFEVEDRAERVVAVRKKKSAK